MLSFLIYTTISLVLFLIVAYIKDIESMIVGGWIAIVLFLLFGWLLAATSRVDRYVIKKSK